VLNVPPFLTVLNVPAFLTELNVPAFLTMLNVLLAVVIHERPNQRTLSLTPSALFPQLLTLTVPWTTRRLPPTSWKSILCCQTLLHHQLKPVQADWCRSLSNTEHFTEYLTFRLNPFRFV
jgi:hypothetical protein